jgi:hypothetical protein
MPLESHMFELTASRISKQLVESRITENVGFC